LLGILQGVNQQHSVDRTVWKRKFDFFNQRDEPRLILRPMNNTLARGHCRQYAFSFVTENVQKGRRVADSEKPLTVHIWPDFLKTTANQTPTHLSQVCGIELIQIDDVGPHSPQMVA